MQDNWATSDYFSIFYQCFTFLDVYLNIHFSPSWVAQEQKCYHVQKIQHHFSLLLLTKSGFNSEKNFQIWPWSKAESKSQHDSQGINAIRRRSSVSSYTHNVKWIKIWCHALLQYLFSLQFTQFVKVKITLVLQKMWDLSYINPFSLLENKPWIFTNLGHNSREQTVSKFKHKWQYFSF